MDDSWAPLKPANWKSTKVLSGRTATKADFEKGEAVFYIPTESTPHPIPLPACAIYRDVDTGQSLPVVVIQAEPVGYQITVGARPLEGGCLVCALAELEFVHESDPRFIGG